MSSILEAVQTIAQQQHGQRLKQQCKIALLINLLYVQNHVYKWCTNMCLAVSTVLAVHA
jgi:hypothetical protein